MRKFQAFTLIEMILVVLIIAIVGSGISLKLYQHVQSQQFLQIAKSIKMFLEEAATSAVFKQKIISVNIQGGYLQSDDERSKLALPQDVVLTLLEQDKNSDRILFLPNGESMPFEMQLTNQSRHQTLHLSGDANGAINFQMMDTRT